MADKKPSKTCLHRSDKTAEFTHLQALSVYSRFITCNTTDAQAGLSRSPSSSFCNIKVKMVRNSLSVGNKRRLDDSCLDETYETPLKKPCLAKCHSPDLACVLDCSDILPAAKPVTPKSSSVVADEANKIGCSSTNKHNAPGKQLPPPRERVHLVCVGRGGVDRESSPCHGDVQSDSHPGVDGGVGVNSGPAFDFDVDEIMCLSPIDHDEEPDGVGDLTQSCQMSCEEEKVQDLWGNDGGYSSCCWGQSSKRVSIKAEELDGKDLERDEGYNTKSYKIAVSKGANYKNPSKLQPILSPVMSTPLARFRQSPKLKAVQGLDKAEPLFPTENPELSNDSAISLYASFKLSTCNSEDFPTIPFLEELGGEGKSPGISTCKSLGCHGGQQGIVTTGMASQVREDLDVLVSKRTAEPTFRVTFGERLDSVESIQPRQFQVKSRARLPGADREAAERLSRRPSPAQQPGRKARSGGQSHGPRDAQRLVVSDGEQDWEREKKLYVDSVTRHIEENTGAADGVMTELSHLMNTVANQGTGRYARQWQHPSDLTRRNFKQHSGSLVSLQEWKIMNGRHWRRFSNVPKVFQRSNVP